MTTHEFNSGDRVRCKNVIFGLTGMEGTVERTWLLRGVDQEMVEVIWSDGQKVSVPIDELVLCEAEDE